MKYECMIIIHNEHFLLLTDLMNLISNDNLNFSKMRKNK